MSPDWLAPPPRLRVARIITRLNIGGPALQALILTERIDAARFEPILIAGRTAEHEGDARDVRQGRTIPVRRIASLRREISPAADLAAFAQILSVLRAFRPHIVHTHMAKAGALGRVAARIAGTPIVLHTYHGNVLSGYFGPGRSRAFLEVERTLGRLSSAVIAISPRQRAELERLRIAPSPKLVEIPLGLDLAPFVGAAAGRLRAELGLARETPLVGIVARLVPIKSVEHFLDAAALLARRGVDGHFVIVGDGELRRDLEERARALGIAERCAFLGWRSDLPGIYADLDVVALTSRNEGFPVSLIEALAAGRPVVATNVGGVADLVEHEVNGLLVRYGDPEAFAGAMTRVLRDPALGARLGEEGRRRVYPQHDAASLVANIERLYEALARSRGLLANRSEGSSTTSAR